MGAPGSDSYSYTLARTHPGSRSETCKLIANSLGHIVDGCYIEELLDTIKGWKVHRFFLIEEKICYENVLINSTFEPA
jgi:hypothetical protein